MKSPFTCSPSCWGVLDDHQVRRVGGQRIKSVEVRIIAATNADRVLAVRERRFREDLYYRLGGVHIHVPPLRERVADIPDLCRFFISRFTPDPAVRLSNEQIRIMQAYLWPGNVRELRNIIERALLLRNGADRVTQNGDPLGRLQVDINLTL